MRPVSPPRRGRRELHLIPFVLGAILTAPGVFAEPAPIDPELLARARSGDLDRFFVVLTEQADVSGARSLPTKQEKTRWVFEMLRATAERTQGPLLRALGELGLETRPYFVWNAVLASASDGSRVSPNDLHAIAARPEVARIEADHPAFVPEPIGPPEAADPTVLGQTVNPNVVTVGADALHERGVRGEGVVVGILDTGAAFEHPALAARYRGAGGDHAYNWFDPVGSSPVPVDSQGHGTHVTGIVLGSTPETVLGVAPDATWIACRGLGSQAWVASCLQFLLAPTDLAGQNPDPSRAPDVTNHSYICPLCGLETAFANLRAAGIFSAVAVGNSGPECESVWDPAIYSNAFGVGALEPGGRDAPVADFSGRGPSPKGDAVRPHLVAPGVSILSSITPEGFGNLSGTSMATPHVAGAVALLWSAVPSLRGQVTETEALLLATVHPRTMDADPCPRATPIPNNHFGWGVLDVEAAFTPIFGDGFESGDISAWN